MYKKLAKIKKEIGTLTKDKTNPFHKSKYFDINSLLEQVEPLLEKENILLLQPIEGLAVGTKLIDLETGEEVRSFVNMAEESNPQKVGSMITYYRRYTLQSLLGLQAEDDDGNQASGHSQPKQEKKPSGPEPEKWLNITLRGSDQHTPEWLNILEGISKGTIQNLADVRGFYKVSKAVGAEIENQLKNRK